MKSIALLSCCFAMMFAVSVFADGGLEKGTAIPELKVVAVAGAAEGEKDFAAERADQPTIYYFVNAATWDRPVARLLAALDQAIAKDRPDVQIIAVFLTDDVAKSKEYLPKAQQSLKLTQTVWSVFPGDKSGPTGWNIDVASNVTVVVAAEKKAIASFSYGSTNDTVAREILQKLPAKK